MLVLAFSNTTLFSSYNTVRKPAVAATWAMPLPMVPAPHTAMVWMVIGAKVSVEGERTGYVDRKICECANEINRGVLSDIDVPKKDSYILSV